MLKLQPASHTLPELPRTFGFLSLTETWPVLICGARRNSSAAIIMLSQRI